MFAQTLEVVKYPDYHQSGFKIKKKFVDSAVKNSQGHPLVCETVANLKSLHCDLDSFSRRILQELYSSDIPFSNKILVTFWWGGISGNQGSFYNKNNLDRIQSFAEELRNDLCHIEDTTNKIAFYDSLEKIYYGLKLPDGQYKMHHINTSFFTKIFQFYFSSSQHPIVLQNLPIIADQWSMKAVLADMIECKEQWRGLFKIPKLRTDKKTSKKSYGVHFKGGENTEFNQYKLFLQYLNGRVEQLRAESRFEGLTTLKLEECVFGWGKDIENPHNPRHLSEQTIRQYFGFPPLRRRESK